MLHSPDHSLSSVSAIAYGSGQLHPPVSPSPSQSQASSDIPHSALRIPHSNDLQSFPPPPPPIKLPARLTNLESACDYLFLAEDAAGAWLKAYTETFEPCHYDITLINQATQALCRTMTLRKTILALADKYNNPTLAPAPADPAEPPHPALVSIDARTLEALSLEELLPMKDRLVAQGFNWERLLQRKREHDRQFGKDLSSTEFTGSADALVRNTPPPAEPSPLPPTPHSITGSADDLVRNTPPPAESSPLPPTTPILPLGPRTSSSATAPADQPASPSLNTPGPSPEEPVSAPASPVSNVSACSTIRTVPVCPTLHRLIPGSSDTSASLPSMPSLSSIETTISIPSSPDRPTPNPQSEICNSHFSPSSSASSSSSNSSAAFPPSHSSHLSSSNSDSS